MLTIPSDSVIGEAFFFFPVSLVRGANSGTLAVRGSIFHEVMVEWQRIDETGAAALPRPRLGGNILVNRF